MYCELLPLEIDEKPSVSRLTDEILPRSPKLDQRLPDGQYRARKNNQQTDLQTVKYAAGCLEDENEVEEGEDDDEQNDDVYSVDSEYSGEDAEIQAAFKFGLLKPGLNVMKSKQLAGPPINNEEGLRKRLTEFKSKHKWLERLDVTVDRPIETTEDDRENDFLREVSFCEQAKLSIAEGIQKLHALKVPTKRPTDYFAEMAKTDEHMQKIRASLMKLKTTKERSEAAKRVREEKRFAVRVQRQILKARQAQKRALADAVKKHQKGAKEQLHSMLQDEKPGFDESKKRLMKNKKYGFGGRKRNMKSNTAESAADFSGFGRMSTSSFRSGQSKRFRSAPKNRSKKQPRPGKSKRLRMKTQQ